MRVPIAHALAHPERIASGVAPLDLAAMKTLSFESPDDERFPCLRLARAALAAGGTAPAMLNAANEVAVEAFLAGRLAFTGIAAVISRVLDSLAPRAADDLAAVMAADAEARRLAGESILARAA
jgi:1-deoxy-D-xylulose-5-phosphate reductoisomerase